MKAGAGRAEEVSLLEKVTGERGHLDSHCKVTGLGQKAAGEAARSSGMKLSSWARDTGGPGDPYTGLEFPQLPSCLP